MKIHTAYLVILLTFAGTALQALAQDATLRDGDIVEIRLGGVPPEEIASVSGSYTVDGQGFINLAHIGKIKAEGLTQHELQSSIQTSYISNQIYTNPTITVSVPVAARFVDVGGAVRAPQRVAFTPDLTVLGAVTATGGFNEFANQSKVRLMRDGTVTILDMRKVRADPSMDIRLRPGDKIEVPQSFW